MLVLLSYWGLTTALLLTEASLVFDPAVLLTVPRELAGMVLVFRDFPLFLPVVLLATFTLCSFALTTLEGLG